MSSKEGIVIHFWWATTRNKSPCYIGSFGSLFDQQLLQRCPITSTGILFNNPQFLGEALHSLARYLPSNSFLKLWDFFFFKLGCNVIGFHMVLANAPFHRLVSPMSNSPPCSNCYTSVYPLLSFNPYSHYPPMFPIPSQTETMLVISVSSLQKEYSFV